MAATLFVSPSCSMELNREERTCPHPQSAAAAAAAAAGGAHHAQVDEVLEVLGPHRMHALQRRHRDPHAAALRRRMPLPCDLGCLPHTLLRRHPPSAPSLRQGHGAPHSAPSGSAAPARRGRGAPCSPGTHSGSGAHAARARATTPRRRPLPLGAPLAAGPLQESAGGSERGPREGKTSTWMSVSASHTALHPAPFTLPAPSSEYAPAPSSGSSPLPFASRAPGDPAPPAGTARAQASSPVTAQPRPVQQLGLRTFEGSMRSSCCSSSSTSWGRCSEGCAGPSCDKPLSGSSSSSQKPRSEHVGDEWESHRGFIFPLAVLTVIQVLQKKSESHMAAPGCASEAERRPDAPRGSPYSLRAGFASHCRAKLKCSRCCAQGAVNPGV